MQVIIHTEDHAKWTEAAELSSARPGSLDFARDRLRPGPTQAEC
jgi:hypothetical protein